MIIEKIHPVGKRGSWLAEAPLFAGTETLPCIQSNFYTVKTQLWEQPVTERFLADRHRFDELVNKLIETGKIILTIDSVDFERLGYIAVFDAELVKYDDTGLTIKLIKRIAECV
jgi:hypothetical protein